MGGRGEGTNRSISSIRYEIGREVGEASGRVRASQSTAHRGDLCRRVGTSPRGLSRLCGLETGPHYSGPRAFRHTEPSRDDGHTVLRCRAGPPPPITLIGSRLVLLQAGVTGPPLHRSGHRETGPLPHRAQAPSGAWRRVLVPSTPQLPVRGPVPSASGCASIRPVVALRQFHCPASSSPLSGSRKPLSSSSPPPASPSLNFPA